MKKSEPSQRQLRVGEEVRRVLAQFLQRGELTHPTLSGVYLTISEVRMTPDCPDHRRRRCYAGYTSAQ